ncbi:MAG: glycosyltransferase family 1 protein [Candidatus Auribacter fodinae]|jgi:hypothetical protein|uniref:Glycosyltransferase family 1 protein n=1 Tax=Candidatus Auribacter fodinae TaxID=2093366 RepID=A0A3A4R5Y9_9BACT|nr:MAG: glycosyltransferase family 1 protein [Candidatus Auribacter fodinae]
MDFIVFSDDWGRHPSSCQHIFSVISQRHKVLWVNTVGMRVPTLSQGYDMSRSLEKIKSWFLPLKRHNENLCAYSPFMLPFQDNRAVDVLNTVSVVSGICFFKRLLGMKDVITWVTVPNVDKIVGHLGEKLIIYNCVDDFSHWPGGNTALIQAQEKKLLEKAHLALGSSQALVNRCKRHNEKSFLFSHGVNIRHFQDFDRSDVPEKIKDIKTPIIGFFGLLYEKIDFDLIIKVARAYPDATVVLVGKQARDVSALEAEPNIRLIGSVPFSELPKYAARFDVGLLPYVLDEEKQQSAPLKIKEYLSIGFPVVCVRVPDVEKFSDILYIADNENDYIEKVGTALKNDTLEKRKLRMKAVEHESWENKVEIVSEILKKEYGIDIHV